MTQAIIFDMDGLLLDTERGAHIILNELLQEYDRHVDLSTYGNFIGLPKNSFPEELDKVLQIGPEIENIVNRFYQIVEKKLHGANPPIKNGAIKILEAIDSRGIPLALATSTYRNLALQALKSAQIFHFFEHIITGDEIEKGKPSPDIFTEAVKRLNSTPDSTLVFEDSPKGIIAAFKAGCKPILIPDITWPDEETYKKVYKSYDSLVAAHEDLVNLI